ncbi:MAG: RNA polymerase sporulation sigma factor SigH [Armatimonadota bacterium]|nr:RNA polymerase sporulation sigma factor SigH [Armatimonadota bacterium]
MRKLTMVPSGQEEKQTRVLPRRWSRYNRLPIDSVVTLAQQDDLHAVEYLLYRFRDLVRKKARSYFLLGGDKDDVLQVGMIGLWRAIMDYSPDKEISFLAFARLCIERHIISAVKAATRRKQWPLNSAMSLDQYVEDDDSECSLAEILVAEEVVDPETVLIRAENRKILRTLVRKMLSDFEWQVLQEYHRGGSYCEIARRLACKPKSVDNALGRIRKKVSRARDCLLV